jgi:hypothetical protein
VEFLAGLADGGRVLELAIETGRIGLPLAAQGVIVEVWTLPRQWSAGCGPSRAVMRSRSPLVTWPRFRSAGRGIGSFWVGRRGPPDDGDADGDTGERDEGQH